MPFKIQNSIFGRQQDFTDFLKFLRLKIIFFRL